MSTLSKTLVDLEKKFWRSMGDQDTDSALKMLLEPSTHGEFYGTSLRKDR